MMTKQAVFVIGTLFLFVLAKDQTPKHQPQFFSHVENHTVVEGTDVSFTCVVNYLGDHKVAWIKADTKEIISIDKFIVAQNPRLSISFNEPNIWKLNINNAATYDSGTYWCQINTDPMKSLAGHLEVVAPPNILEDDESESVITAIAGGTVTMTCYATGMPHPKVTWTRQDGQNLRIRSNGSHDKQVLPSFDGETLTLASIQRTDMGVYVCSASNGVPPSTSKRYVLKVNFPPLVKASEGLVTTSITDDVLLECYVEASPRAMNYWNRESGKRISQGPNMIDRLTASEKYIIEDIRVNEYSRLMKLQIRNLEKIDFGTYICVSINDLGKAEGVVQLQESHSSASIRRYSRMKSPKPPNKNKGL